MDYVAYLIYGNGEKYMIGLRRLGAHQTAAIDVKAIRDNQIPDETGKVLPVGTVRGQIQWTVRARAENKGAMVPENLGLIGQSEQHDAVRGMNSTYYCENCCPGSYAWSIILPTNSETEFEVGKVIPFVHIEVQDNCYGDFYQYETTTQVSWSSTVTGVAITNGNIVTVIGVGTAQIKATFVATAWAAIPCLPGEETPFAEETIAVESFSGKPFSVEPDQLSRSGLLSASGEKPFAGETIAVESFSGKPFPAERSGRDSGNNFAAAEVDLAGELDFINTFARRPRGPSDWSGERLALQDLPRQQRGQSGEEDFMLMPRNSYRTAANGTSPEGTKG